MRRDLICPICNGDIPLSGDEKPGDDVFCPTCQSPCVVRLDDSGETDVEADL